MSFTGDKKARAELYIDPYDPELREKAFAELEKNRPQIEGAFGDALSWEPLETKQASRVGYYTSGSIDNRESWPVTRAWMLDHVGKLRAAIQPFVERFSGRAAPTSWGPARQGCFARGALPIPSWLRDAKASSSSNHASVGHC